MLTKQFLYKYSSYSQLPKTTRESYTLLRELLRLKYKYPLPMRSKFAHNVKEAFSVVSLFGTEQEQQQLLSNMLTHDLPFLKKLTTLPEHAYQLFDKRLYSPELYIHKNNDNNNNTN
ncbi:predicted protein [Naegleria gruberi]|uniref:Predicted protein n=1 Tax=Naegleria gruberi TaxID=5762 RepID=D2VPH1_NAEGR|nr:uncharacterized protein NAEGRDRAFT_70858 [Naegleria gruberi]EFC41206.1 predicted protein [Naegleria gruberi]|eukprot:XP_002673950.1 predicted protein [Naegleria gruberi strain NEG-M]